MSKRGRKDKERREASTGSPYPPVNTARGYSLSPSLQPARSAASPGYLAHVDQMRGLSGESDAMLQDLMDAGYPIATNRRPTNYSSAMPRYLCADTLRDANPPPHYKAANTYQAAMPYQGGVPIARPSRDERAARINNWLDNVVDQHAFTPDIVADASIGHLLDWRGAVPASDRPESRTSSLRPSPGRENTSPYLAPAPARQFEAQLPTRPVNPVSQAKSQSSDFGFMTQPFPGIPPNQPPQYSPPITRPRSGAITGTGPPPILPSAVQGLSPNVTPYRGSTRPRRPRFPSYYDEDIIEASINKNETRN